MDKLTLCVRFGRRAMQWLYVFNAMIAVVAMWPVWQLMPRGAAWAISCVYAVASIAIAFRMGRLKGSALTPLLGMTAMLMFAVTLAITITAIARG